MEQKRFELSTSSLRTKEAFVETPINQSNSDSRPECAHESALPDPNAASNLARLLAELAALPPQQRAAIAALLAPVPEPAPSASAPLDDRLPWESERREGGTT